MKGGDLEIAPNGTAMTQGFHSFKTPVRIDSFQPHGHFRLVGKTLEIFYPETGKLEMVSSVSNWTNSWHTSHIYEDDVAPLVPKGAVLVITGYYDNTAANKQNPDPDQWVGLGSRTADEMSHAWIAVTHLDDEGYERLVAEREAEEDADAEQPAVAARRSTGRRRRASRTREALSLFESRSMEECSARTMARRRPRDCVARRRATARSAAPAAARAAAAGGARVAPFFDGWYANPDGTTTFSFGYSNLNREEIVEIPLGPDNFIEPKEFDGRQPTSFPPVVPDVPRRRRAAGRPPRARAGRVHRHRPGRFQGRRRLDAAHRGQTYSVPGRAKTARTSSGGRWRWDRFRRCSVSRKRSGRPRPTGIEADRCRPRSARRSR